MGKRIRWRIAHLLDRLPGQCWTELVCWALDGMRAARRAGNNPLPWRPIGESCRRDAIVSGDGCCYCAKIGEDGRVRRA